MRIALIVDHPLRDLPGLVLVAYRLCQKGATCFLVPMNLQHREIEALRPDFVLLSFLRRVNENFAWTLNRLGIPFGVLDSEGGVRPSIDSFAQTMASRSVRNRATFFCSWGPRFAQHALAESWYGKDQLVVTGCPRYDYYAEPWRRVAVQLSPSFGGNGSPLVLVNGNFPIANPRFQTPGGEIDSYVKLFGMKRKRLLEDQSIQRRAMKELTALVNRLAQGFPKVTFLYRPHPFERLRTYEGLLIKRENLILNHIGSVDGWILRSQAVIQRSCVTAIESSLAGVPTLSPLWIPGILLSFAEKVSTPCRSEVELGRKLESILKGEFQTDGGIRQRLSEIVRDWYFKVDGQSHERVAQCILKFLYQRPKRGNKAQWWDRLYWMRLRGESIRSLVGGTFRRLLGIPPKPLSLWETSGKYFHMGEVKALVGALRNYLQREGKTQEDFEVAVGLAQRSIVLSPSFRSHGADTRYPLQP